MHLLTWHGTFVCLPDHNGAMRHQVASADDGALPLEIDLPDAPGHATVRHPELGTLQIEAAAEPGAIHLLRDGLYMCAENDTGLVVFDRPSAAAWESFLPLSAQDAADLGLILRYRWIVSATRRVIHRRQIGVYDGFKLQIGPYAADLATSRSNLATRRGENGLPVALTLRHAGEDVELVVAEPRSSALVQTEMWPPRGRRIAEILTFAAHRQLAGLEPTQDDFERDVKFLEERQGAAGLEDLLERFAPAEAPPTEPSPATPAAAAPATDDVLMGWALREIAPWRLKPVGRASAFKYLDDINETRDSFALFRFEDGEVALQAKPEHLILAGLGLERAERYLAFFQSLLPYLLAGFSTTICVGVGDALASQFDVPMFGFQKRAGWNILLLPDIDFLNHNFYVSPELRDGREYSDKQPGAVFAGGTTGGRITPEIARDLSLPRLRAARYFMDSPMVDFRLPAITQCATPEAEALLRAQPFCQAPVLGWYEQFQRRMLISIDGNGATCSRVAIALLSNSVLLKYASDQLLYYFGALQPWMHYVPILQDSDVERVIEMEARDPALFERIAANGREFAETYLNADAARRYTAMLLRLYDESFSDQATDLRPVLGHRSFVPLPVGVSSYMVAHLQNWGDRKVLLGSWIGERGSAHAMEGLAISLAPPLPEMALAYQVVMPNGKLSEVASRGEYRGTRGEALPIYGVVIAINNDFAAAYDVQYEATFIDGTVIGPVAAGTLCVAPSNKPIEALRITLLQRET